MASFTPEKASKINAILQDYTTSPDGVAHPKLPGSFVSVLTSKSDEPVYLAAQGVRNLEKAKDDPRGPVTPDTLLSMASCTKLLTSLCLLHLIEQHAQGNKQLVSDTFPEGVNSKVDKLLPELAKGSAKIITDWDQEKDEPVFQDISQPITVAHLLSHSSGLTYSFIHPFLTKYYAKNKLHPEILFTKNSTYHPILIAEPGSGFSYGQSTDWVGVLVERLTKEKLGAYMKRLILDPLGMESSSFEPSELAGEKSVDEAANGMTIHTREGDKLHSSGPLLLPVPRGGDKAKQPEVHVGGAGLISTVRDYSRLLLLVLRMGRAIRNGEAYPAAAKPILSADTAALLFKPAADNLEAGAGLMASYEAMHPPSEGGTYEHGFSHSLASGYATRRLENNLSPDSIMWGGVTHLLWYVDPSKDVACMTATQMWPHPDATYAKFSNEVTTVVFN